MLHNLRFVTTAYFDGEPISVVKLSLPTSLRYLGSSREERFMDAVLKNVNLHTIDQPSFPGSAAEAAIIANGVASVKYTKPYRGDGSEPLCLGEYPPPELILAVERSRQAVVLTVLSNQEGCDSHHISLWTRAVVNLNLGTDRLARVGGGGGRGSSVDSRIFPEYYWQQFRQELEYVADVPLHYSPPDYHHDPSCHGGPVRYEEEEEEGTNQIRRVVLLGDSVEDDGTRLLDVLRDVLGEKVVIGPPSPGYIPPGPLVNFSGIRMVDPMYAAVLGNAKKPWTVMNGLSGSRLPLSWHKIDEL